MTDVRGRRKKKKEIKICKLYLHCINYIMIRIGKILIKGKGVGTSGNGQKSV